MKQTEITKSQVFSGSGKQNQKKKIKATRVILKETKEISGSGLERNGSDDKLVVESRKSCSDEWSHPEYPLHAIQNTHKNQ